jgi:hypothetical protein
LLAANSPRISFQLLSLFVARSAVIPVPPVEYLPSA